MPNGKEILNDLDYEKQITTMSDRALLEFTARQLFEHCEQQKGLTVDIEGLKKKTFINRIMILGLVVLLVALGVIDAKWLHIFGI